MKFTVSTDHKPLVPLFRVNAKPPPRIERWMMYLTPFSFDVQYQPGDDNASDFLSRSNPLPHDHKDDSRAESYVYAMLESTLPVAISKSEFKIASKEDKRLTELKDCIITGSFKGKFKQAAPWKPHLPIKDDVVVFKDRVVVPKKLRTRVLQLAHEGHQGIVRTKQRLRSKVW